MADLNGLKLTDKLKNAYEKAMSLGLRFTSGYRPGSTGSKGKPDSHSKGMAFDVAGSAAAMKSFADWSKQSGLFTEVLYGADGHFDHVHVGWEKGKHADGQMYVGNKQLIPIPNGGADIASGDTVTNVSTGNNNTNTDTNFVTGIFTGTIRTILILVFLIFAIYFFFQAFPSMKTKLPI